MPVEVLAAFFQETAEQRVALEQRPSLPRQYLIVHCINKVIIKFVVFYIITNSQ